MLKDELEGLEVFAAVAEARSLREAGDRLGVSGSAVSQALRKLEERLGVVLVQRTTRSLRLTEAGERLHDTVGRLLDEMRAAVAMVGELGAEPRGTLRVLVAPAAEHFLSGDVIAEFLRSHPQVQLELHMSYESLDIVAEGFDAGIRLGEVIDRDMIAVPVSGDIRLTVVGAPAYFARRPPPAHPRELVDHECINWRPTLDSAPYRWEFTEPPPDGSDGAGREFSVEVGTRVLTNDPALNLRLARKGLGLTLADDRVRDEVQRGTLVRVLDEYMTAFPGFYLYYPQRRQASPALRAFVEYLRNSSGKRGR